MESIKIGICKRKTVKYRQVQELYGEDKQCRFSVPLYKINCTRGLNIFKSMVRIAKKHWKMSISYCALRLEKCPCALPVVGWEWILFPKKYDACKLLCRYLDIFFLVNHHIIYPKSRKEISLALFLAQAVLFLESKMECNFVHMSTMVEASFMVYCSLFEHALYNAGSALWSIL